MGLSGARRRHRIVRGRAPVGARGCYRRGMAPRTPPVVRVLAAGAALTLAGMGCAKEEPPTGNPPPPPPPTGMTPPPTQPAPPAAGPPGGDGNTGDGAAQAGALPSWESVGSNHPKGATNPPMPVLAVTEDGRCFKEWRGGMLPPDPEVMAVGGRVISGPDQTQGTETQCPPHAQEVLAAHATRKAGGDAPGAPDGAN